MKDYYQLISSACQKYIGNSDAKLFIYAEVEDGAISCDLFFLPKNGSEVIFRFSTPEIQRLVYDYWETGQGPVKPESWAVLRLLVNNGKFTVEHEYPEDLNPNEDFPDRRPKAVSAVFPDLGINYSKPTG